MLKNVTMNESVQDYKKLMKRLEHVNAGRTFTRDEANEC